MSSIALEAYLARLYTDSVARKAFLADPVGTAREFGLTEADANALRNIDKAGLQMAAASYAHKRAQHRLPKKKLHELLLRWWKRR